MRQIPQPTTLITGGCAKSIVNSLSLYSKDIFISRQFLTMAHIYLAEETTRILCFYNKTWLYIRYKIED